jgi:hypothetical protein
MVSRSHGQRGNPAITVNLGCRSFRSSKREKRKDAKGFQSVNGSQQSQRQSQSQSILFAVDACGHVAGSRASLFKQEIYINVFHPDPVPFPSNYPFSHRMLRSNIECRRRRVSIGKMVELDEMAPTGLDQNPPAKLGDPKLRSSPVTTATKIYTTSQLRVALRLLVAFVDGCCWLAMAPFLRKRLQCFYCGRHSSRSAKGAVREWTCDNCQAANYLDEVRIPYIRLYCLCKKPRSSQV